MGKNGYLSVRINPGKGRGIFNVTATSNNGPLASDFVDSFSRSIGGYPKPKKEDEPKHPEYASFGEYMIKGSPVLVTCDIKRRTLTLNGIPAQVLPQVCFQEDVHDLMLGAYNDSAGRFKLRQKAKQEGIKVVD